jgi:CheY-like chemotaxis protein
VAVLLESRNEVPRMLVADDDPSVLRALADRCVRMGFDVDTASNGIQALLKASRGKPDILLIDVNMPEVDGLTACAHLLDPIKEVLNVIVMSGGRNPDTIERCERLGVGYVRKGSTFWVSLEGALAEIFPDMADRIREPAGHSMASEVRERPRVLLIDDDNDVNRYLHGKLEKRGVELLYASDAPQGLRIACRDEPNLIVTDYLMPNGDGQYLLTRLRTTAATAEIPVIVLTGRQLSEATAQDLKREIRGHPGATLILKKSEDTRGLFAAIEKFCGLERANSASIRGRGRAGTADRSGVRSELPAVDYEALIIPA